MNKLESIVKLKCPRCNKGNLFIKPGIFRYRKVLDMHENCEHCDLKYLIEPGFWIGALWTSYPIIILIELPFLLGALLITSINIFIIFLMMVLIMLVLYPLIFRLGRSIWIHIFISKTIQ